MEIAGNFSKCGLNAYVSKDIKYDMWKKVVLNCILNPVTSILKINNGGITNQKLNSLKGLIADECVKVAKKEGVNFNLDFVDLTNKDFNNAQNISSMRQDLIKGKKTEIDCLNGAVSKLGKKHGVKCPVNEALANIINSISRAN